MKQLLVQMRDAPPVPGETYFTITVNVVVGVGLTDGVPIPVTVKV
jgi:hypothetical protein